MFGKLRILAALLFASLSLSSCVSNPLSPGFSFSELGNDGLIVIKARPPKHETIVSFIQADLQSQQFVGQVVHKPLNIMFHSRHLAGPDGSRHSTEFFVKKVKPGDYAFVSTDVSGGNRSHTTCNSIGAPVFRIEPGRANLVDLSGEKSLSRWMDRPAMGPGIKKADIERLTRTLTKYPKLKSDVVPAKKVATIGFASAKVVPLGRRCPKGNSFLPTQFLRRAN